MGCNRCAGVGHRQRSGEGRRRRRREPHPDRAARADGQSRPASSARRPGRTREAAGRAATEGEGTTGQGVLPVLVTVRNIGLLVVPVPSCRRPTDSGLRSRCVPEPPPWNSTAPASTALLVFLGVPKKSRLGARCRRHPAAVGRDVVDDRRSRRQPVVAERRAGHRIASAPAGPS